MFRRVYFFFACKTRAITAIMTEVYKKTQKNRRTFILRSGCRKSGKKRENASAPSPSSPYGRIHLSQRERQDWYSIIVNTVLKRVYFDKKITILGSPSGRAGTAYAVTERVSISNLSFQIGFSTSWVHHAQPELSTVYTELSTGRNRQS